MRPIPWIEWYRDELADLRAVIADVPHPAGAVMCAELYTDLERAAYEDRHADAGTLERRIRQRAEQEHVWYEESRRTARNMRLRPGFIDEIAQERR